MSSLILPPIKPSHYRPDIDGLRAIAIVSVVIFHTFPTQFPGGFVGVDVFLSFLAISFRRLSLGLSKRSHSVFWISTREGFVEYFQRLPFSFAWCHITWLSLFNTRGIQKSRKATIYGLHLERTFSLSVIPVVIGIQLPK